MNEHLLTLMHGDQKMFLLADVVQEGPPSHYVDSPGDSTNLLAEFLRTINDESLPPDKLNIKVGCPLILLQNLAPGQELCNSSQLIVSGVLSCCIEVSLLGGDHDGETAFISEWYGCRIT
jgi:hypothetical protein